MTNLTNPIFHDDEAARKHLEKVRWPHGPVCPHCKATGEVIKAVEKTGAKTKAVPKGKKHRPARAGLYYCNSCESTFTVTVGSIMEKSHIPISKWMLGFFLMASSKKSLSAHQLGRQLGLSYKSAWFMAHRIREAMTPAKDSHGPLGGEGKIVESDETFVGGKAKNAKKGKPVPKKHPVVALVERGGPVRVRHVADVTAKSVRQVLDEQVSKASELQTDDSMVYYWLGREFAKHSPVNHSREEYVSKDGAHVNTCESYFALLKRGVFGSFHAVSAKHLEKYAQEFAFRWNHRVALGIDDTTRTNEAIKGAAGKRLTYRRIDATNVS